MKIYVVIKNYNNKPYPACVTTDRRQAYDANGSFIQVWENGILITTLF